MPLVTAGTRLTAALLSQDYSQTDISTFVVTQSTTTPLTAAWTIPANDPNVGTTYRLTAMGLGQQGSTNQALKMNLKPGGAVNLATTTGFIATSATFQWRLEGEIVITAIGSAGTFMGDMSLTIGNTAASAGNYATAAFVQSVAINTTVANSMFYQAFWNATIGAPTISCYSSIFERLGG